VKKLVTVNEIKSIANTGKKILYLEPGTIVTPAAKDAAAEWGISLREGPAPVENEDSCSQSDCQEDLLMGCEKPMDEKVVSCVDPSMISRIVLEVVAGLSHTKGEMKKEEDPSGLRLIRGKSVECETFNTGNPQDKVGLTEILTRKESPDMATGFMTIEESSFYWELKYAEIDYIIEGTLDFIVDGRRYRGRAGDVFYIPKDSKVTFSTPDYAKFFFVTYPANWDELSGYEKNI